MPEESVAGSCTGACVLSPSGECVSENSHRGSSGWHGAVGGGCYKEEEADVRQSMALLLRRFDRYETKGQDTTPL